MAIQLAMLFFSLIAVITFIVIDKTIKPYVALVIIFFLGFWTIYGIALTHNLL